MDGTPARSGALPGRTHGFACSMAVRGGDRQAWIAEFGWTRSPQSRVAATRAIHLELLGSAVKQVASGRPTAVRARGRHRLALVCGRVRYAPGKVSIPGFGGATGPAHRGRCRGGAHRSQAVAGCSAGRGWAENGRHATDRRRDDSSHAGRRGRPIPAALFTGLNATQPRPLTCRVSVCLCC